MLSPATVIMRMLRPIQSSRLVKLWIAGKDVIPFSLLASLFTCSGSSLVNELVLADGLRSP